MSKRLSNRRATLLGLALVFGVGAIFAAPVSAHDDDHDDGVFTERSIQGTWGWSGDGVVITGDPDKVLPTVGLGTTIFDGRGRCSVTSSVNINGEPFGPVNSTECVYFVNPDGTGHSVATFDSEPFVGEAPVSFVIVDGKNEIRFIQNNQFVVTFIAKRIHRND